MTTVGRNFAERLGRFSEQAGLSARWDAMKEDVPKSFHDSYAGKKAERMGYFRRLDEKCSGSVNRETREMNQAFARHAATEPDDDRSIPAREMPASCEAVARTYGLSSD